MAHFPTWSHGISMWLRWHLDCIYCLAMGHLCSPWVWLPLLWQSSHLTGTGERCVLYIKLVSSCLSPGICFSVFPSSFQEKAHRAAGGDAWIHTHHSYIYDSFQNIHDMVTANPGLDNSASSRYCRTQWIPLRCVEEDCKSIVCRDVC